MNKREPDFNNLKKVLARQVPEQPVMFDLFYGENYVDRLSGMKKGTDEVMNLRREVAAFAAAGCDYATVVASDFCMDKTKRKKKESISLNDSTVIINWESFEKYEWENPEDFSDERLVKIAPYLPGNLKLMVWAPHGGIMEHLQNLMGFDNICYTLFEEPELLDALAEKIGTRLLKYYESALQHDTVGCICYNDDWGFNTQTFISPKDMRRYVFPWCRQIVNLAHKYNKPVVLHSCGYFNDIFEDIVDIGFDARHSYEDNIIPVEKAYDIYGDRIAILGGIDLDYVCRETPEKIYNRSRKMLEKAEGRGGYALGTGNSVPDYVPFDNYMALVRAALEY